MVHSDVPCQVKLVEGCDNDDDGFVVSLGNFWIVREETFEIFHSIFI